MVLTGTIPQSIFITSNLQRNGILSTLYIPTSRLVVRDYEISDNESFQIIIPPISHIHISEEIGKFESIFRILTGNLWNILVKYKYKQ